MGPTWLQSSAHKTSRDQHGVSGRGPFSLSRGQRQTHLARWVQGYPQPSHSRHRKGRIRCLATEPVLQDATAALTATVSIGEGGGVEGGSRECPQLWKKYSPLTLKNPNRPSCQNGCSPMLSRTSWSILSLSFCLP